MRLSKLTYHNPRDYWKMESSDFSNWLSKSENFKLLSDSLGIPMTFVKREATKNSRMRVDILAKNSETEELIIIENQLEETDHSHLGKLVTYASIFDSKTIIWIVKDVRKEHELAINWLNNNSKTAINLFLIRIELISIDNSDFAPLFTIISNPINFHLPKLKTEFDNDVIKVLNKRSDLLKEVLDERIIDFFDRFIELGVEYTKYDKGLKTSSLFTLLKNYNLDVYLKYEIRRSRDLKNDLIKWCEHNDLYLNKKQLDRTGKGNWKKGGVEYFMITKE